MQSEYTTDPQGRQAPREGYTPVDLHDGAPVGYWVKDSQGRVTHLLTMAELPLCDRAPSGRVRPWRRHHLDGLMLAEIYAAMGEVGGPDAAKYLDKARRLEGCAQYAEFVRLPDGAGLKLHKSSFCRVRLCPMCQWRRSLKLGAQVRRVVERANADHITETGAAWRWLMVTFTVKNVEGPELGAAIDAIHKGLNNLAKSKRWAAAVKGWLRATEVTHNTNHKSGAYDTYHPHMHLLLCVPSSYFSGKGYIRQTEWAQLWGHYIKADYTPIVDVRPIKPDGGGRLSDIPAGEQAAAMGKACAEVSKYAAKPADYIVPSDPALSMQTVQVLDAVLNRRRMTSWGGCLKDIAKALQLDDPEMGDLVHIDDTASTDPVAEELADYIAYSWALGARNYLPVGERRGKSERVERAERAQTRAEVREYRRQQETADVQADSETVTRYLDMHSMTPATLEMAKYNLRTLSRAQLESEIQDAVDIPEDIKERWGIDDTT